jgi:hypothetical protein
MYYMFTTDSVLRSQIVSQTPSVLGFTISRGIKVDKLSTHGFVHISNFQDDDHLISTSTSLLLQCSTRSLLINFRPGFSTSNFQIARAIREHAHICISAFDYHCNIILRFETSFLEIFKQWTQSTSTSDLLSQHAHRYFLNEKRKLSYIESFSQPSGLTIAQVVNLSQVRSAVPNDGFICRCNSFSFHEA